MTVKKLHGILTKLLTEGCGRLPVCIDKASLTHALEGDGMVIFDVADSDVEVHNMMDGDGGMATRKDGREIMVTSFVLFGEPKKDVAFRRAQPPAE